MKNINIINTPNNNIQINNNINHINKNNNNFNNNNVNNNNQNNNQNINSNITNITKPQINKVSNRFLRLSPSVNSCLEPEPKLTDFHLIKELGSGSFGRVILVMHKKTKCYYALKVINKQNKSNIEGQPYFKREIEIMYKLHHQNCVRLFGNFEDEKNCYFIMEYVSNGNLYTLLKKKSNLDLNFVAHIMKDLISAVYYLHSKNPPIIHRDIKPENALLSENNELKLTDFGWSNYVNFQGDVRNTFCGTPIYLAPEMIRNQGHDEHVDIWCIGVLLFELIVGNPPFFGHDRENLMSNICNVRISWPNNKKIDADAKDLICKILVQRPEMRPTLKEIIKHNFFAKFGIFEINKNERLEEEIFVVSRDTPNKNFSKICEFQKQRDLTPKPNSKYNLNEDKKNYYKINNNNNSLENEFHKIKKENEKLKEYLKMLNLKLNNKDIKLKELSVVINNLNKENEILKLSIENKDKEIQDLKNKNISLEKQIEKINSINQDLKNKNISLNQEKEFYQNNSKSSANFNVKNKNTFLNNNNNENFYNKICANILNNNNNNNNNNNPFKIKKFNKVNNLNRPKTPIQIHSKQKKNNNENINNENNTFLDLKKLINLNISKTPILKKLPKKNKKKNSNNSINIENEKEKTKEKFYFNFDELQKKKFLIQKKNNFITENNENKNYQFEKENNIKNNEIKKINNKLKELEFDDKNI